jgi:HD-GYP domain-containing protein (c-di-GMP phosphodiesterase class II)
MLKTAPNGAGGLNATESVISQDPSLYIAMPLETVPCDTTLPYSLHLRVANKLIRFRSRGDVLTGDRLHELQRARVPTVYLLKSDWSHFLLSMESSLLVAEAVAKLSPEKESSNVRTLLVAYGREVEQERQILSPTLERFQRMGHRLTDLILRHANISARLVRRFQEPNFYFVNHSVNVAVYAIIIGKKRGLSPEQLNQLAFCALVHNAGNIHVNPKILYSANTLTPEEKKEIDKHAPSGSDMLKELKAPDEAILVAKQHHLNFSEALGAKESLHLFSRIISIADVYDAVTSPRPFKPNPLSPQDGVNLLRTMEGRFDPSILPAITGKHS